MGAVAVIALNLALRPAAHFLNKWSDVRGMAETVYRFRVVCRETDEAVVRSILIRHINSQPRMTIQSIATQETETGDRTAVVAEIFSAEQNDKVLNDLLSRISIEPYVTGIRWERLNGSATVEGSVSV
jgi:putative Mg2+ transporter-C (MgtC) family protein